MSSDIRIIREKAFSTYNEHFCFFSGVGLGYKKITDSGTITHLIRFIICGFTHL